MTKQEARKPESYKTPSAIVLILTVLFSLYIVMALVGMWSGWRELKLLRSVAHGFPVPREVAEASDFRQSVISVCQMALMLSTAFFFCLWIYRACKNAVLLGAEGMRFTPGWCVGWFFIPVMNLFRPYQAVKEVWRASDPDHAEDWRKAQGSWLLVLWWGFWAAGSVLGQAVFRLSKNADELSEIILSSKANMLSDAWDVPLTILALLVVRRIHAMQEEKRRRIKFGSTLGMEKG